MSDEILFVYTDGSTLKNGKKNSIGGIGVYFGEDDERNVSESYMNKATNQRTELYAVIKALQIVKDTNETRPVMIVSDSKYVVQGITDWINNWKRNGWKSKNKTDVKNKELWVELDELKSSITTKIAFTWVRGHTDREDEHSQGNRMADELAVKGSASVNTE